MANKKEKIKMKKRTYLTVFSKIAKRKKKKKDSKIFRDQ